jgi:hypothetical protein
MVETFTLGVELELIAKNLEIVQSQIRGALKKVPIETDDNKIKSQFKKVADILKKELSSAVSTIPGLGSVAGIAGKGSSAGASAGAGAAGAVAGIGVAVVASLAVIGMGIKNIYQSTQKMIGKLGEANASFQGSKDIMERMWNIALRPIASIMTIMMRPFLIQALRFMKPQMQKMQEIMHRSGGNPSGADLEELNSITQEAMTGLAYIFKDMMIMIQPIASSLDGFKTGLDIAFNTWLSGVGSWISSFLSSLEMNTMIMPPAIVDYILKGIEDGSVVLSELPKTMQADFLNWLRSNPEEFLKLPTAVKEQIEGWLESTGPDAEKLLKDAIATFSDPLVSAQKNWATTIDDPNFYAGIKNIMDTFKKNLESSMKGSSVDSKTKSSLSFLANANSFIINSVNSIAGGFLPKKINNPITGHQVGLNYVPETGIYNLHKGETVTTAGRSGGNKSIVLSPNISLAGANIRSEVDIDSLMRRASRSIELDLRSRGVLN